MNSTFKKVALASALLASSALVAPQAAFANAVNGVTAAAANVYVAPVTDAQATATAGTAITPVLGYGQKIKITAPAGSGLDNATGTLTFRIFYFDASNTFLFADSGALVTTGNMDSVAGGAVLTVSGNTLAKKAAIVVQTVNGTDTLGTADHNFGIIKTIISGTGATNMGYTVADLGALKQGTATDTQVATAILTNAADLIAIDSSYAGPLVTSAAKPTDGAETSYVAAYFSMPLATTNAGDDVKDKNLAALKADGNEVATVVHTTANAGATSVQFGGTSGGPFTSSIITAVKPKFNATPALTDLAGNSLALGQSNVTVNVFAKPKLKTATAPLTVSSLVTDSSANRALLLGAGLDPAVSDVKVSVLFAEDLDTSKIGSGDFNVTTTGVGIQTVTSSGKRTAVVTLRGTAGKKWAVDADGQLTHDGTVVKLKGVYESGSPITNAAPNTAAWGSAAEAEAGVPESAIKIGVAPTPTVATRDDDVNGLIDGATVDFGAAVGNAPASADFSVKTNFGGTPKDITFTPTKVSGNDKAVKLVITSPATVDWSENGTAGEAADSDKYVKAHFNTGINGADVKYTVALATSPSLTYTKTFDPATGELAKVGSSVMSGTFPTSLTDGASPVVTAVTYNETEGSTPASGKLTIVASEGLTKGTVKVSDFIFDSASLQLLNLNDKVADVTFTAAPGTSTGGIANDSLYLENVTASVVGKKLTLGSAPGYTDGAAPANQLATDGTKTVTAGTKAFTGPKIVQAIGTRSSNAVDGNIDQVLVKFDKAVALASSNGTTGTVVDGMFKVKATVGGAGYDISIPKDKVDMTSASSGYVTLNIPAPGIVGSIKLTALQVEYDTNGSNDVGSAHTSLNRLVSTDGTPAEINENNAFGTGDDGASVTYSQNTTKLYTMEVTGSLTTDGSAAAAKGTIVRADLVDLGTTLTYKSGVMTVPCSCAAGSTSIAVTGAGDIVTKLNDAVKLGKGSINAYANVTLDNNTGSAIAVSLKSTIDSGSSATSSVSGNVTVTGGSVSTTGATTATSNGTTTASTTGGTTTVTGGTISGGTTTTTAATVVKSYPVTISTTGAVTGTAGAVGNLVLEKAPALKILDTVYQVTNTGAFRFAVGSDTAPEDAFVLVSAKQPADKFFTGLTSPVQSFANYLPFASNVTASGVIGGQLGTINLAKIASASVADTTAWQLVGFQGAIARNSNATLKTKSVDIARLLITARPTTGEPATAWAFDNETNANDEGFLLLNNVTSSALQIGSASIDGIKDIDGGFALALKNPSGGFTTDSSGDREITSNDANVGIADTTQPFSVFYPITGDSKAFGATAGKWSLLTVEQTVASASLSSWADTNKVAAIIVVGSGNAQKSWFKNSTTNTLTALSKGDRAFIYFEGANTAFKFGR